MTPSTSGRTAIRCPGVRPSIALAAVPTATTWPVFWLTATTEGSVTTIPLPRRYTSVFAVPRSMPTSFERSDNSRSKGLRMGKFFNDFRGGAVRSGAASPLHTLKLAHRKRTSRNNNPQRDANKVAVLEFFPCAPIAVVVERLNARAGQLAVQLIRFFFNLFASTYLYNMRAERRYRLRPHNALFIGKRFNNSAHQAAKANAVATHQNGMLLTLLVF